MDRAETKTKATYLDALSKVMEEVVAPAAHEVDRNGDFPRAALNSLGRAGILGLISAPEVGGLGEGHRAASEVVERLATACASTAMVVCMHYAGTAVIEAHGDRGVRRALPGLALSGLGGPVGLRSGAADAEALRANGQRLPRRLGSLHRGTEPAIRSVHQAVRVSRRGAGRDQPRIMAGRGSQPAFTPRSHSVAPWVPQSAAPR